MDEANEPKEDGKNHPRKIETGKEDEPSPAPFGVHQHCKQTHKSRSFTAGFVGSMADIGLSRFRNESLQFARRFLALEIEAVDIG